VHFIYLPRTPESAEETFRELVQSLNYRSIIPLSSYPSPPLAGRERNSATILLREADNSLIAAGIIPELIKSPARSSRYLPPLFLLPRSTGRARGKDPSQSSRPQTLCFQFATFCFRPGTCPFNYDERQGRPNAQSFLQFQSRAREGARAQRFISLRLIAHLFVLLRPDRSSTIKFRQ